MKFKKKTLIIGAIVLALGLIAGFAVLAGSGPARFCGKGFHPGWHGRGFHSKFSDGDFHEHILERLDRVAEHLDLSEDQEAEYAEIKTKVEALLTEGMEERRAFFREIRSEMDTEVPDLVRVAALVREHAEDIPAFVERHVDLFVVFYNILDENQKAELATMIREKAGRIKGPIPPPS